MMNKKVRCECPVDTLEDPPISLYIPEEYAGMVHKANECRGTYQLTKYRRDQTELWLCSCCCMSGDTPLLDWNSLYEL